MAQGGSSSGMDEEESEDTEDFVPFPFMDPLVLGVKKEGDEKFQSRQYEEAAAMYTLAMNFPIFPFMDTSSIAEKLFRKRATCFFKMGKYIQAIEDCERAIELADIMGNKNLLAKSIFIKMKAIVCLGDYVPAFKLAVWCKHLRPNCEITKAATNDLKEKLREAFKKDGSLIDEVLGTMVEFAEHLNFDDNTRELALESYTELLDLLDFMLLPEVLRMQAGVLMNLGRCDEAKDICAKVLWLRRNDLKALELMTEIMQRLREGDLKQTKETKKTRANAAKRESSETEIKAEATSSKNCQPLLPKVESQASFAREEPDEIKTNDNAMLTCWKEKVEPPARFPVENSKEINPNQDDVILESGEKKQSYQVAMENPEAVAINAQQKMVDSDQTQGEYATAKENEKAKRRKKKNRKKKEKKKEKKKAQQQNEGSPDQAPVSNVDEEPLDESPDEGDSQATDSVLGDPDIYLGYQPDCSTTMKDRKASFTTSDVTAFSTLGINQDEGSDFGDFIPVQNTRRLVLSTAKASTSTSDLQKQFGERASGLDWIDAPPGQEFQSVTEVKALPLTPETSTSQLQGIPPSSGFKKEDNVNTSEARRSLSFGEFPNVAEGNVNRPTPNSLHMGTSGNAWVNINPSDASPLNPSPFQSEFRPGKPANEQLSSMSSQGIHGQTSSSTGFACSTRAGQSNISSNPVTFFQSFQTNSATRKHSLNPPPGLLNGPINIPEGVYVVCDHFLQNIVISKTCQFCEERGILKYAAWNKSHSRWQVMRPYPRFKLPPRAIFYVCKHFASGLPCLKEPCTFPHGEQETIMWTLERQGLLASPEESLKLLRANNAAASMRIESVVQENGTNSRPLHIAENRGVSMASFGGSTVNRFPGLEAVLSQSDTTRDSNNTSASIWSPPLETSGGSFQPFPPLQETSQEGPLEAFSSHSSTEDRSEWTKSSARSSVLNQCQRTVSPVLAMEKPIITTSHVGRTEAVSAPRSYTDSSKDITSPGRSSILNQSDRTFAPVPPITTSHVDHTEAVSSISSTEVSSESTAPPTYSSVAKKSAKPSAPAVSSLAERHITTSASLESSKRPSTPVLPSKTPANVPCQSSTADSATTTSSSAQSTSFKSYERPSSPLPPSGKPATMTSSAGPTSKTGPIPSSNSYNDFRKIPKGVYVVCDDFLWKNQRRPASIYEKTKACKGCENRSRLKYAVWSDNSKQWQLIRPYPAETVPAKVAFKECARYASTSCLKNACSFAHGQLELIMWTMEREGVLPTPRETLTGSSGSAQSTSKEGSSTMQPAVQLRYRPSPPGVTDGSYRICRSFYTRERCRYGRGCIFAHSPDELKEWEQEYDRKRKEKLRKEREEKEEIGSLELASKILKGPAKDRVEYLPGIEVTCTPPELNVRLKDKNETHKFQWTFSVIFKTHEVGYLEQVLLLHRYHNCYQLSDVRVRCYQETPGYQSYKLCYTAKLNDPWYKSPSTNRPSGRVEVSLTVSFESHLYGSFEQLVLFDFGKMPYLVKKLNADVMSESLSQTSIVPKIAISSATDIWDEVSMEVVRFVHGTSEAVHAEHLSRTYCLPKEKEITAETLSPAVYKSLMHQLLFVEEGFMKDEISRYTLTKTQLHAQWNIFDEMTGMKCAVDGELFGVLYLQEEDALRPDDAAGRLLYRNVSSVWLQIADSVSNKVYEAPVEKVESECVVLRLSSKMCSDLKLYDTCDTDVNAQFQLNRTPLCEMHAAVDRLTKGQLRLIFPEPRTETVKIDIKIRWQWLLDERLNKNQKEVIERIALPEYNAPPLVVFGPFGTGKTFTLYQAVRLLVQVDKSHRILLCTHSNRAADIHVELLHDYLTNKNGIPAARPLRVYQPMRRLETASEIARKYCLIKDDTFVLPSRDDLVEHRVVVTTLSTSKVLLDLQVLHGFFTHILIDEAAQALEPEALTPLIFAGPNTKVVFTGDHMQMSPEVYSPQARSLGLQKSLAERLFDVYDKHKAETSNENPKGDPNVLFLTENYRCHKEILQFPSDNFYGEKLVARGHKLQPEHPKYGPLLFFSARGKEKKEHDNSYINLSEVYEVAKRVKEIADSWPIKVWGPKELSDIAVLSSYRYQVQAIRNSLRKDPDLRDVKVDTIHNVQGEEFRVLFISTVRTFHTCKPQQQELHSSGTDRQLYWEFLSDPKLLNTAVTRARCLVAVIGDPVSLCTVGECRSIWRDYIKRCNKRGGLHGTTMQELEKEINASIASIELNPKAQPFVPTFPKTPEKTSMLEDTQEKCAQRNENTKEENRRAENVREAQPSETHRRESPHQKEVNGNANESESRDGKSGACVGTTAHDQEERETEEDADDEIDESGDFLDNLLEDETIFPRDMDEIILAFVRKCEETLQINAQQASMFEESEFPTLQAAKDVNVKHQTASEAQRGSFKDGADIKDLFPEVRVVNGRVEVRLTNLGFYTSPSERAKKIMISTKQQEFLDPSVLMKLLKEEPEKYIVCNLRLSPERSQVGYADVEDTKTPSINIKGRIRQAFDKDKVVVELAEKKVRPKDEDSGPLSQGKVVGVLEHIIPPHERQFVCSTDYENPALMVPINKSATRLVNLTDKSCKDIPIYKKDQNERATQVRMMKREKVLSGKYLFVVKYLQWRRDFSYPLGIVVRTLSRGEDLKSSMEIAYAEHGIRRTFKEETNKYVKENFPPEWSIPETERKNRTKVVGAFTIDPPKSLDLDDALTIESDASSSTFVVGIHIADVSFFVKPNSPLDHEAFLRCTSYYPGDGQENVPMLPPELSENACSLLPNEDRLAVSVFVNLDEEGKLSAEPSIKRTIIRSCCRLSYAEAQMAIRGSSVSSIGDIPVEVLEKIRQLSSLAQKRRRLRLRDCAFDHWQNEGADEGFEAHELVEEMMILANEEIAKFLSQKSSELAPLRIQLPPKDHRLAEWIEIHGKYARLSLKLSEMFNNETTEASTLNVFHDEKVKFKVQRSVWSAMCHAVDSSDLPRLHQLICNEKNHPQVAVAMSNFRRIQSESRYVCEGDQPPDNIFHYSLRTRCYTHFTSPIRRYIDIVVHRLLLAWQFGSSYAESPSKDDIAKACRRSTFMCDNARKFDKDCKRIHMANQLQQRCRETRVFIESIEHQSISLHISNHEDDHLAGKQKRVLLSHLNLVDLKEEEESKGREKTIVLKWKFRKYIAPDARSESKKVSKPGSSGEVAEIPSDIWLRILDAVRINDNDKLAAIVKQTETKLGILSASRGRHEPTQSMSPHNARGVPYKHPHHNEESAPSSEETADHFYEKSIALRKYEFFSVQLCPHMTRGILQPDIQIFKADPHINICIEHHRYPRESFAHTARHQASRERYRSIDEYIKAWKPVLAMEAATEAVKENDGFIIEDLEVKWKYKPEDDNISGLFTLPWSYCGSRQLTFFSGDLACIRVPYCDRDTGSDDETSNEGKLSTNAQRSGDNTSSNDFWVVHCILKEVTNKKEIKVVEVQLEFHQTSSNIPDWLTHGNGHKSTLELIHRTLPQRRMYAALCINLIDSSELVHAICKGEEPSKENYGKELPPNMSLMQHGFQKLNRYQETAVREALSKPFTLIQGPPGTGKTVTGVHIAYWFAEQNKRLKSYKVLEKDTGETECAGACKAPPQVIYCGPSNKSVDVVAEYLLKIPNLKIVRVYSDQIEQKEFPVPNKLKPPRATRSQDELKISSEKIRCVSLHHVIRGPECPFSQELRQYEEAFEQSKAKKESIGQKEVTEYCKLIGQAEKWVLQKSGVQIILCTCATSGSPRLTSSCDNIQQCIVDECGMCMEPESLVPITCSGARQVVLIGDHKQLQPVIQNQVAKALGLTVSMFERHSNRAKMLELQYRMQVGICEFPSKQFYGGKLQTADSVKSRAPSPVTFWPAQVRRQRNLPIVFCHVEGLEESSVISTSESNEESKRNMKEVRKAVQIAKYLVNRHRPRVRMSDVVILSPYREQRSKITELLKGAYDDIQVTTVTKSQGSEWDYVIMSLVRSLKRDEIDPEPSLSWLREHLGFLTDEHQMNVGLTRARRGLCIIGNKYLLGMDPMWKSLLQHYEDNHCLVDESWPWS